MTEAEAQLTDRASNVGAVAGLALERFILVFEDYFGFPANSIGPTSRLLDDLGFDSLEMMEVILLLDSVSDSLVPLELVDSIATVSDVHHWMTVYAGRSLD